MSISLFFRVFSLRGFPFVSGFYIKELVVNGRVFGNLNLFSMLLFYSSILFTVFYSFRLYVIMIRKFKYNYGVMVESVYVPF